MNTQLTWIVAAAGGFLLAFWTLIIVVKRLMHICRPNEVLIFSGRTHHLPDGSSRGYRVVFGGRVFKIPFLETVDRMDMTLMPINVSVTNAYSAGGIPLNVSAIAQVKVSSNPATIGNAIERFLGHGRDAIAQVARETLEGNLRGVLATLTPEQVNEDRLRFAKNLEDEVDDDLEKLGLHLDTLKIQKVEDEVSYLESIGRRRIAEVIRDAEIAESDARREAESVAAAATAEGDVALSNANATIARKQNELRKLKADLEAMAKSEEERAAAAAKEARAAAEAELQEVRTELERLRLQADVVLPADAERRAEQLLAKGRAAPILANGAAEAEVSRLLHEAWLEAGDNAQDIFLIHHLEQILGNVVERVKELKVGKVSIIDSGDGRALPRYVSTFPATVTAVLEELKRSTGIDVNRMLAARPSPRPAAVAEEDQPVIEEVTDRDLVAL